MDPALHELLIGPGDEEVAALIHLEAGASAPSGVTVVARLGSVASVRLRRAAIERTWEDESVVSLKAPRTFGLDPDPLDGDEGPEAEPPPDADLDDERRPPGLDATGRGVIVAVIDWGFDFAHPNFRNEDGTSRALAFWDQTSGGPSPSPYG